MQNPWEQPPFWERERGGGPITEWTSKQQKNSQVAAEVHELQQALLDGEGMDEEDRAWARNRLRELGAKPLRRRDGYVREAK